MCSFPPEHLSIHHTELVERAETIVLAETIGSAPLNVEDKKYVTETMFDPGNPYFPFGRRTPEILSAFLEVPRAKFRVVRTIKGSPAPEIVLTNGYLRGELNMNTWPSVHEEKYRDFDGHQDGEFWHGQITRQGNSPDCRIWPHFDVGKKYLLFPDREHYRSYEEIIREDDKWLIAVERLVANPILEAGLTVSVKDWLSMAEGVFVGTVVDTSGPILSVDHILHGTFSNNWRSVPEGTPSTIDGSWPYRGGWRENSAGKNFLVVSYDLEPPETVYRNITVLEADQNGTFDFTEAFDKSNVKVTGSPFQNLSDLKEMFQ